VPSSRPPIPRPAGQATAARRRYQTGFWTYEGSNGLALAGLGPVDEDTLTELLLGVITPPVERLQQIADQLEETGTLNAGTVAQLRQVVDVLTSTPAGPGARTAAMLGHAAEVFSTRASRNAAASLREAADMMPSYDRILQNQGRPVAAGGRHHHSHRRPTQAIGAAVVRGSYRALRNV
jgi:hypothetical protein